MSIGGVAVAPKMWLELVLRSRPLRDIAFIVGDPELDGVAKLSWREIAFPTKTRLVGSPMAAAPARASVDSRRGQSREWAQFWAQC